MTSVCGITDLLLYFFFMGKKGEKDSFFLAAN